MDVTLFVDESKNTTHDLSCKVVVAPKFNSAVVSKLAQSFRALFKCFFRNPKQSFKLYKLDKKDGVPFKQRIKNLIFNQYLLNKDLIKKPTN